MPQNLGPISSDPDIPTKQYVDDKDSSHVAASNPHAQYAPRDAPGLKLQWPSLNMPTNGIHRIQAGGATWVSYWGGCVSSNGNNDGVIRVPMEGRYLVTVSANFNTTGNVHGTAGHGRWGVVDNWGGSSYTPTNQTVRPVLSEMITLLPDTDYCPWVYSSGVATLVALTYTITWIGG